MELEINHHTFEDSLMHERPRKCSIKNPHIDDMEEDVLYHLGFTTTEDNLRIMFADVKFVCVGGTVNRMHKLAQFLNGILDLVSDSDEIVNISKSDRYSMFKVGPVLCVNHGIGSSSLSVVLNEIMKLMYYAGAKDPIFLRLGTCGGLGVSPGTLVITSVSIDGMLRPYQELVVLGERVQRSSVLNEELSKELKITAEKYIKDCNVVIGKTMCADDFYEGQGRLDGAFCEYSHEDKVSYFNKLIKEGVKNIEMESLTFAAMCRNAGVKGGVICVCLLDRLQGDQIKYGKETFVEWQNILQYLAAMYIKDKLNGDI